MNEDKSYERYKQYRLNKYRYEQEQITFPIAVILILATIIGLWKYIVLAITIACGIAIVALLIYLHLKRQVTGTQPITLTKEQANDGVNATINITYKEYRAILAIDIPPNVKDGEKFVINNVTFEDGCGKQIKKRVHLKIKVN